MLHKQTTYTKTQENSIAERRSSSRSSKQLQVDVEEKWFNCSLA